MVYILKKNTSTHFTLHSVSLLLSPFRYYYQLSAVATVLADGFLGIIRYFGWKRVAIITQNENVFTVVRRRQKVKEE